MRRACPTRNSLVSRSGTSRCCPVLCAHCTATLLLIFCSSTPLAFRPGSSKVKNSRAAKQWRLFLAYTCQVDANGLICCHANKLLVKLCQALPLCCCLQLSVLIMVFPQSSPLQRLPNFILFCQISTASEEQQVRNALGKSGQSENMNKGNWRV